MRFTALFLGCLVLGVSSIAHADVVVDNVGSGAHAVFSRGAVYVSGGFENSAAMKFTVPGLTSYALTSVEAALYNDGGGDMDVAIVADDGGAPGTTVVATLTPAGAWPTEGGTLVNLTSSATVKLTAGTTYWIRLTPSVHSGNYTFYVSYNLDNLPTDFAFATVAGNSIPTMWNFTTDTPAFRVNGTPVEPVEVSLTSSDVTCRGLADGVATATVTKGVGPYTYLWSNASTSASLMDLAPGLYSVTVTDQFDGSTAMASVTITQAATALTATLSSATNVACNGDSTGMAEFEPSGGGGSYTYLWDTGATTKKATGLSAGNHTVVITDAFGCAIPKTQNITQPTQLMASVTNVVQTTCETPKGSFQATTTGGTGAASYSWTGGLGFGANKSNVSPGTYTVTATDANDCKATAQVTLNALPVVTANVTSSTNVLCRGGSTGSATVMGSGGDSNYTYAWSPAGGTGASATHLAAGNYTVTVTDGNGCAGTDSVTITQPATALSATISASTNLTCHGDGSGDATASAMGGTGGYTYAWSPRGGTGVKATGLDADDYTVTVTDANDCKATANVTITEPPKLMATISSKTNATCHGDTDGSATASGSGGTASYTYSWSPSGGTAATASNLAADDYTATVMDANGCTATAVAEITEPAALSAPTINATPNPATEGDDVSLGASGSGATSYAWTGPDSFTSSSENPELSNVMQTSAGVYTVTYSVGTCESPSSQILLLVNAAPEPDAGMDSGMAMMDAAVPDGGGDAATGDASVDDDGGAVGDDGGPTPNADAGNGDAGTGGFLARNFAGGGGCAVGRAPGTDSAWLLLVAAGLLIRRRRRHR